VSSTKTGCLAALAIATTASAGRATAPSRVSLAYAAPHACPDRDAFQSAVRDHVGNDPFAPGAPRTLDVQLSGEASKWHAVLRVRDGKRVTGTQELDSPGTDCAALFSASVAVASVMLQAPPPAPQPKTASHPPPAHAQVAETPPGPRRAAAPAPVSAPAHRVAPRVFVGLALAQEGVLFGGGDICANDTRFVCYLSGTDTRFKGTVRPGTGHAGGGVALGAQRLFATLTWELGGDVALDLRFGAALGGTGPRTPPDRADFTPWQIEAGARYFLAPPTTALRGYVGASVGYAWIDGKVRTDVTDCGLGCTASPAKPEQLDAWERLGPGFASARLGARWTFIANQALGAAFTIEVPFPNTGVVLAPSLDYSVGF
jgi:hypothetical protein